MNAASKAPRTLGLLPLKPEQTQVVFWIFGRDIFAVLATGTAKTPRVHGVTQTPALTVNTVLSRTGTGLRCDGAITDSAPTICAGFIAGSAQYHRVHGFQRIPARRPFYHRYPDRSSHGSLASTTTPSLAGPGVVIHNNYVLLLI